MRDSKRPSLSNFLKDREKIFVLLVALFTVFIIYIPGTKLSTAQPQNRVHAKAVVLSADNSMVQQFGIVKTGEQILEVRFLDGPWKGDVAEAQNQLVGKMELDKFFRPQDRVLAVVDADGGNIIDVTLIDRYRLDIEAALLGLFVLLVVAFAGWTGVKAILSFVFTAVMLWKVLLPGYHHLSGSRLQPQGPGGFSGCHGRALSNLRAFDPFRQAFRCSRGSKTLRGNASLLRLSSPRPGEDLPFRDFHRLFRRGYGPGHGCVGLDERDISASSRTGPCKRYPFGVPGRPGSYRDHDNHVAPGVFRRLQHDAHGFHRPGDPPGQHTQP